MLAVVVGQMELLGENCSLTSHNSCKIFRTGFDHLPCKQSDGYPIDPAALVFPTQFPFAHPTPETIPILSLADSFASAAVALVYASSQVLTARFETFSSDGMANCVSYTQSPEDIQGNIPEACTIAAVASTGRKKLRILK
jgi:hypothetical protein